jgi:hypothetical protein
VAHKLYCYYFGVEDSYCNFEIVDNFDYSVVHYEGQGGADCNFEEERYNLHC